jgi:regulator of protease activity HflC (stomatin/prohibitin superfamily)
MTWQRETPEIFLQPGGHLQDGGLTILQKPLDLGQRKPFYCRHGKLPPFAFYNIAFYANSVNFGKTDRKVYYSGMGFLIIAIIVVVLLAGGLKVIKEYQRGVIFRLGRLVGTRGPGLIYVVPIFEKMVRIGLRTVTMNIPSQKIITKDNVSIDIAAVAYYHIVDAQKSVVAIEDVHDAVNQISQTTVRNVVGQFMLDQFLSQTIDINEKIKNVIDVHTEPWGIQVTAVEIKDVILPDNMQRAMAKEAEAERERRAKIVAAEGEFQASEKLGQAADIIASHPVALQLRTLQTMAEIATEKNSTIIFPAQFMTTVKEALETLQRDGKNN